MPSGSERQTQLSINLGGEQVKLVRLEATEALGQPFYISVDIVATLGEIDLLPHLGKPAAISVSEDDEVLRHFHGIIVESEFLSEESGGFQYRLTLRPKTYLIEQNRNYRIFQDKTVKAILEKIFGERSIDVDFGTLSGGARKRTYCVQYGESDFGFLTRLMEEEGIYYYYVHSKGGHKLTLCDKPSSHSDGTTTPLSFNPTGGSVFNTDSSTRTDGGQKFVQRWHERVSTGSESKVTMRDFDFMKPQSALESVASEPGQHPLDATEVYEFPGRFYDKAEGKALSDTVLQMRRASRKTFSGESQAAGICCGTLFNLIDHGHERFNAKYLITQTQHSISTETYRSTSGGGDGGHLVRFESVPAETAWKSPQTRRRPIVHGPETAIVTGPPGETIHIDKYARIKVQFHWDREGKKDDKSSCWIRVAQTGGLGNVIHPQVGQEVVVDFLDGNPDRPIVIGRVYNESHMPIYPLPANKTRAVWRTTRYGAAGSYGAAKSLDSGAPAANELRFEDKGGKEEVYFHAERDLNTRVRHIETHHVGLDQKIDVGQDQTLDIHRDRTTKIKRDEKLTIKGLRETKITKTDLLDVTQSINIKAGIKIEIEVGSSKITLDQTGVKIEGINLSFKGTAMAEMKSPLTTVSADALMTVKGAMVFIN
jgi:type VI secretion system secreted protein VgrG